MILEDRIDAFKKLGVICGQPEQMNSLNETIKLANHNNPWFTHKNIRFSLSALSHMLDSTQLYSWVNKYNIIDHNQRIGVIVSSNIPFVGFFDFLCILLSGNIFIGQLSSSNNILLPYLVSILLEFNSDFSDYIFFESNIKNVDLLIATGSDNSAHYFRYNYANIKKIVRSNRTSVAILNGFESVDEYKKLADDVYRYFGLGCRSVSKLFLPVNFNFDKIKEVFKELHFFESTVHYIDNYKYQKTLHIMNDIDYIDCNNLLFVQSKEFDSPISVLYYDFYENLDDLVKLLEDYSSKIQCIVAKDSSIIKNAIPFGLSQKPTLYNYPDGVDVMKFITTNKTTDILPNQCLEY
tara:strand:+ start:318 stop:1370 length:1053 start_codon:yes stop_codon:yes gene_type:complete